MRESATGQLLSRSPGGYMCLVGLLFELLRVSRRIGDSNRLAKPLEVRQRQATRSSDFLNCLWKNRIGPVLYFMDRSYRRQRGESNQILSRGRDKRNCRPIRQRKLNQSEKEMPDASKARRARPRPILGTQKFGLQRCKLPTFNSSYFVVLNLMENGYFG
jgi:hypothetical protein